MNKSEIINEIYSADLTKRATLVAFYLINRANKELTCFPGIKTIAKDCNMSTRTVQRALNDLVDAGYVKKESRYRDNGGQSSNLFTLIIKPSDGDEGSKKDPMLKHEDKSAEIKDEDSATARMGVELVDFDNYENKDVCADEKHKETTKKQNSKPAKRFIDNTEKGAKIKCYITENRMNDIKDIVEFIYCHREGDNFAVP